MVEVLYSLEGRMKLLLHAFSNSVWRIGQFRGWYEVVITYIFTLWQWI